MKLIQFTTADTLVDILINPEHITSIQYNNDTSTLILLPHQRTYYVTGSYSEVCGRLVEAGIDIE